MKYSYTGIDIQNYLISFLLASKCFNPVLLLVLDSRFLLYLELIHKTDNSFGFIRNLGNPLVAFPGLTYHVPGTRLCKYASSKKLFFFNFQKLRCQRKEPCQLFSVRKNPSRPSADEVSTNSLCQCPHRRKCPKHHLDVGVIPGKVYSDDSVRTYSGYCM